MVISGLHSCRTHHQASLGYGHVADSKAKRILQLPGVFGGGAPARASFLQVFSICHSDDSGLRVSQGEGFLEIKIVAPRCCLPSHASKEVKHPLTSF